MPERLRFVLLRKRPDVIPIHVEPGLRWYVILLQAGQRVPRRVQRVFAEELVQVPRQDPSVDLIGDASAVVCFGDEVLEGVPGCFLIRVEIRF